MEAHPAGTVPVDYDELSADSIQRGREHTREIARLLETEGFQVRTEVEVNPYLDARADLLAFREGGPSVVVEIRELPPTARVLVDTVQQVQHMTRLVEEWRKAPVVGLLVSNGRFTSLAEDYAARCTPRVYLAALDRVRDVVSRIVHEWQSS